MSHIRKTVGKYRGVSNDLTNVKGNKLIRGWWLQMVISKRKGSKTSKGFMISLGLLWSPKEIMIIFTMTPLISFRVTVSFIYPLKASGILWFFDVFRGIERYQWHGMYLVGINAIYFRDRFLIFGSI